MCIGPYILLKTYNLSSYYSQVLRNLLPLATLIILRHTLFQVDCGNRLTLC